MRGQPPSKDSVAFSGSTDRPGRIGMPILLPAVALIAAIVVEVVALVGSRSELSRLGDFDGLRSDVIVIEAVLRVAVLIVAPVRLLIMLFERRQRFLTLFERWAGALPALSIVTLLGSYLAFNGSYIPGDTSFYDRSPWIELIGLVLIAFALTIYIRRSAAARNAFIN